MGTVIEERGVPLERHDSGGEEDRWNAVDIDDSGDEESDG